MQKRDWGHTKDYDEAMWLMLQQNEPEDFVIATGVQCSVREFIELVCKELDLEIQWSGSGTNEKGLIPSLNKETTREIIEVDDKYFRPLEVESLLGDASKARKKLNWEPRYTIDELVSEMVKHDLSIAKSELDPKAPLI